MLNDDLTAEQLRGMLCLKQVEIQQRMVEEKEKLARVETRLKMIEQENEMHNYDIVIKKSRTNLGGYSQGCYPQLP